MVKLSIFLVCVFLEISYGSEPQVYEAVDDQLQVESNARVVRQPFGKLRKIYQPQVFQYQGAIQQDPRRSRYIQQQQIDFQNIQRKSKSTKEPEAPLRVSLVQNWQAIDPASSSSTVKLNYDTVQEETNETLSSKVTQHSTKKPVTSRKLKPNSYYDDISDDKIKRQDNNQIVYVNPEVVKNERADYDLNALNALVGQDPNNQLQGLQRLLQNPQGNLIFPPIKGTLPHPIVENTPDIPNPNTHPNIDTSLSIESLQAQLDQATKAQLAKAVADAQKEALAHVEAQHQAIARAQKEAQEKALAQIALHNQGIRNQQPLALALKQEVESQNQAIVRAQQEKALAQIALQNEGISEGIQQPLALALKPEVVTAKVYAPNHNHRQQNEELGKANLKKISITKTHSVTQGHQSPNAYQQVVLETQKKSQKVLPGIHDLRTAENVDDHQYAARYAFGYKIRDVKMGNEFGHEEKRDGENAKGLYHVLLPDGRMQKVEYYVDPSGYHAKVTYENLAHH